ncbi:MAG: NAD(P)H-dependent oxidoreductase [Acutalibacteraceae bacterium]
MKILVLNGSPKGSKSNTIKLTNAFTSGICKETDADVEVLTVSKMNIRPCTGCFSCWNKTPGKCCINDDMADVISKILSADIIIWSFPLYYFSMPGGIKNLMDRQLPTVLPFMTRSDNELDSGGHPSRYDMSKKRFVVISTCGFHTASGNYNSITEQFDREFGKGGYTYIFCGQGELFSQPELKNRTDNYLEIVMQAGEEFANGEISPQTANKLKEPLYPRDVFEQMADASWGIDSTGNTADPSYTFTKQMACLYNPESYMGKDRILEIRYTDINTSYQITLGSDKAVTTDKDFKPYTTLIETPFTLWQQIARGEIRGDSALMEGKYRVSGDFSLMLKWDEIFGSSTDNSASAEKKSNEKSVKKTNMSLTILPWMALWILLPINPLWCAYAGIAICLLLPICLLRWKFTAFDIITLQSVAVISILSALGIPAQLLTPASYLLFGIMWSVTVFRKIPLTAYYSKNQYNGDDALNNPMFMKTNRILTACWGVLYLLTPIWTYFLMGTDVGSLTGAVNSVLPAIMGIFTVWFQKWYPARIARGK